MYRPLWGERWQRIVLPGKGRTVPSEVNFWVIHFGKCWCCCGWVGFGVGGVWCSWRVVVGSWLAGEWFVMLVVVVIVVRLWAGFDEA